MNKIETDSPEKFRQEGTFGAISIRENREVWALENGGWKRFNEVDEMMRKLVRPEDLDALCRKIAKAYSERYLDMALQLPGLTAQAPLLKHIMPQVETRSQWLQVYCAEVGSLNFANRANWLSGVFAKAGVTVSTGQLVALVRAMDKGAADIIRTLVEGPSDTKNN
jgi:hypothetical protein